MSDIIGFLIVLFIFLFPFFVQLLNRKKKEEEVVIKPPKKREPPILQKKVVPAVKTTTPLVHDFEFRSDLDDFKQESRIEKRKIQTKVAPEVAIEAEKKFSYGEVKAAVSKAKRKISLKEMVIYSEIYDSSKFN